MPGGTVEVWTPSATYYRHSDWLGSSRLDSTIARTMYSDVAYAPFGDSYAQAGTADPSFTGMNQDTTSGIYDFPAREYSGVVGRWPSPDPAGIGSVNPGDPQTWNRYAYVRNNPLTMVDPTGLDDGDCEPVDVPGAAGGCEDYFSFDWEGDFGFGTTYTLDGVEVPPSVAEGFIGNPDASVVCPDPSCGNVVFDQLGQFAFQVPCPEGQGEFSNGQCAIPASSYCTTAILEIGLCGSDNSGFMGPPPQGWPPTSPAADAANRSAR